jgi:hypothetical protein
MDFQRVTVAEAFSRQLSLSDCRGWQVTGSVGDTSLTFVSLILEPV